MNNIQRLTKIHRVFNSVTHVNQLEMASKYCNRLISKTKLNSPSHYTFQDHFDLISLKEELIDELEKVRSKTFQKVKP